MDHPTVRLEPGQRLPRQWYLDDDVVRMARALLGKYLVTEFDGRRTAGRIVETEAYRGPDDRASHAWGGRRTPRTEVMYWQGGTAYVYLCYGIHHLFNVVTGPEGLAHAVLVRALEPAEGLDVMLRRRGMSRPEPRLTAGPGTLTQALGIRTTHTGTDLTAPDSPIWIEDRGDRIAEADIVATTRIGVDYAGPCAQRPWRFYVKGSRWVSRK